MCCGGMLDANTCWCVRARVLLAGRAAAAVALVLDHVLCDGALVEVDNVVVSAFFVVS